jgi:hypothetical protein
MKIKLLLGKKQIAGPRRNFFMHPIAGIFVSAGLGGVPCRLAVPGTAVHINCIIVVFF